jgi:hypothetical protein
VTVCYFRVYKVKWNLFKKNKETPKVILMAVFDSSICWTWYFYTSSSHFTPTRANYNSSQACMLLFYFLKGETSINVTGKTYVFCQK